MLLVCAFFCGSLAIHQDCLRTEPLQERLGKEIKIEGKILKVWQSDYGCSLLLRPLEEGRLLPRRTVWISVKQASEPGEVLQPGWQIRAEGTAMEPAFARNPGGFDQRTYLRTLGAKIKIEGREDGIQVLRRKTSPFAAFRWFLQRRWEPVMGAESCGGLMGLLFGDSSAMEEEAQQAFQRLGLSHLLAVSGLHVGLCYGAVKRALRRWGAAPWVQGVCATAAIGYAALSGFSPSASRAALMLAVRSAATVLHRPYDMASAVSFAGLLLLARQPCQLFSAGLQLSLLAAFGIACVLPRIAYSLEQAADQLRSQKLRIFAQKGAPLLGIQLITAPICASRFHWLSLPGLLLNPLCIAAAGILLPLSMLLMVLTVLAATSLHGWLVDPVFRAVALLCGRLSAGLMNLGRIAARCPGTFLTAGLPPGLLALYYCAVFTWSSESFFLLLRKRKRRLAAGWIAAALIACHLLPFFMGSSAAPLLTSYESYPAVFVDVGQGDCLHLRTPGGKHILIDGGGSAWQGDSRQKNTGRDVLLPYLLHCGADSLDLALVTHLHADHFQGIAELSREIPIAQLGLYEANRIRESEVRSQLLGQLPEEIEEKEADKAGAGQSLPQLLYLKAGNRIQIESQIYIDVLAPPKQSEEQYRRLAEDDSDENDSCLIFKVHYRGMDILVTGDMGFEGEDRLLDAAGVRIEPPSDTDGRTEEKGFLAQRHPLQAHLLKVGHHGSRYSTGEEFLRAVSPQGAVICTGTNYFGHPSPQVIALLEKNGIMVGRTDEHGAVIVDRISGQRARVKNGNGELLWHINLKRTNPPKTRSTPISESRNS